MEKIRTTLLENNIEYSEQGESISVNPESPEGFEVTYAEDKRFAYVSCLGWHDEFEDREEAMNCFLNALTSRVRLLVTSREKHEYKWEYQALVDNEWESYGVTCLLTFPFWRKSNQIVKCNRLLK